MSLFPRMTAPLLLARMQHRSITVLTGSRQTGKTTLVRDILPSLEKIPSHYLSLDDPDERALLRQDPVRRLDHPERVVILDEVQKQPELLDAVKFLADKDRARRFLLLGSSQILLMKRIRESLAGRATLLELHPLALAEKCASGHGSPSLLDRLFAPEAGPEKLLDQTRPSAARLRKLHTLAEAHFRWGGYPGLLPLDESQGRIWLRDFRRTYLERDLADLGRVADLDQFALAQQLLAARTGQLLSYSKVSRDLGVAVNTVKRYLRFLEISYQAHLLQPLLPTATGSLVKSPKLYWTDPGLADSLAGPLPKGALFETAVMAELLRWQSWQVEPPQLQFHRTHGGAEVDFVIHDRHHFWAMEAKAGRRAHPADTRSMRNLLKGPVPRGCAKEAHRLGLVITQGDEVQRLDQAIWAVPACLLFATDEHAMKSEE